VTITNRVSLKSVNGGNTPIADVVDAPTIGTATAGAELATVAYTAAATGGAATSFTAISTPGSITGTGASPITVSGLTAGTAYTFKVYGTNAAGVWSDVQSQASNSVTPAIATSFESIATSIVGVDGASSITFSSIPSTYTHLQIRATGKSTSTGQAVRITFNSDTGNNYASRYLFSNGSSAPYAGAASSSARIDVYAFYADNSVSNVFGTAIIDILDYANTNKNKVTRCLSGFDQNTAGNLGFQSGLWMNTDAITSITFAPQGGNWAQHSSFALYGIKG